MTKFSFGFAIFVCLVVVPSVQSIWPFWRPKPTLPPNPNDPYYNVFQTIPPAEETAKKLLNDFLNIYPRTKRQAYTDDIVVVIDGSGSIGSCEFDKGKKALKLMIEQAIGAKVAAVTFSSSAKVNFNFLPHNSAAKEIIKISYPGGSTNTQAGLAKAKNVFDNPSSGGRPGAVKKVIVVTDGQSNVKQRMTIPRARALKDTPAQIYVLGVGAHIHGIGEMVQMASSTNHLFRVKDYKGLLNVAQLMVKKVSPGKYQMNGKYNPPCRSFG